jgi:hypothetical protein
MEDLNEVEDVEVNIGKFKKQEDATNIIAKENTVSGILHLTFSFYPLRFIGYYYGKTVVPITDEEKAEFKTQKPGKELKVIQFTSRESVRFPCNESF